MFVELVIIIVFGQHSFLWHHHTQQYASVAFKQISLLDVLKSEVVDRFKVNGDISSLKDINNGSWVNRHLRVI